MLWKEIQEGIAKEEAFLDTIDIIPYLERDKEISLVIDEIETDYGEGKEYKEEPYLFNCMGEDDFINYLIKRYPNFKYYEYSEYRVACF